ncbi:2-amino-4-hydroxy-6-hydroxymethyldihydropteridine diphosphokinase [Cyanobium sp. LEGE 06143]|uniref:2-amino-4-hydroxy-6- hydroxymethyldihydropteridine diphosphokinase n=1 Tax=Cyanobium sp. LEGE 06143 TaxID=945727 RepID=UPI0018815781|nr:2-amino-4-hydroxy-6-hydroxymethyldihydropteridine diphosphokinase [Cyanobium sp. LEGE 06143]
MNPAAASTAAPGPSTAIALGANLGDPLATLTAVRPLLSQVLQHWAGADPAVGSWRLRWSPLFRTAPVGGPAGQPPYLNAVLLASGPGDEGAAGAPSGGDPLPLLLALQSLEAAFGRQRLQPWGPRSLDLDLLWCGGHRRQSTALWLPHPLYLERTFVLAPLAALAPELVPPDAGRRVDELLAELVAAGQDDGSPPPQRLAPQVGWPE